MTSVSSRLAALRARRAAATETLEHQTSTDVPGVWLALPNDGQIHLYIRWDGHTPPAALENVDVRRRTVRVLGAHTDVVDVVCPAPNVGDVWEHFLTAYLKRAATGGVGRVRALREELEAWRAFLTPSAAPPSATLCAEVLGELLLLRDLCRETPTALSAWVGARHDFRAGGAAIEVKTTRATTSQIVTIHGEEQLVVPEDGTLHLHFVRLEHTPGQGLSVQSVVQDVLDTGVTPLAVYEHLTRHKMSATDVAESGTHTFSVLTRLTFPVDEDFPRIVPSSFAGDELPRGVGTLSYQVDLTSRTETALDQDRYRNLCRLMAASVAQVAS